MQNDPIVEEMRAYGKAFAESHGNDIARICSALRKKQENSEHKVVSGEPNRLERKFAS